MASIDWHDALSSLASQFPANDEITEEASAAEDTRQTIQKTPVHIFLERKGRGGKTATIICDLTLDDAGLKELAASFPLWPKLTCPGMALLTTFQRSETS